MIQSGVGVLGMLSPKRITMVRRLKAHSAGGGRVLAIAALAAVFWLAAYGILYRILVYFQGVEDIGDLLAAKLYGLILLTFVGVLVLSNVAVAKVAIEDQEAQCVECVLRFIK